MRYFLGIDQGGTSTKIAVCAGDGTLIGAAAGEPSIFYLDDPENISTSRALRLAEKVIADAGLTWDCLSAACGGLTGIDWPHEVPIHESRLRSGLKIADITVTNDCIIALRAGSSAPDCCIVCAGTGLNIAAHSSHGTASDQTEYVYGYFIPDRLQGGLALGRTAIDAVTEADTGIIPPTALTGLVLSLSGCSSAREFLTGITTRKIIFAPQSLVPGLLRAVLSGDGVASKIVNNFTYGLSQYIENALTRFFPPGCNVELVYSGGVFKGDGRIITEALTKTLSQNFPSLRFTNARLEPACGALLMLLDREYNGNIPQYVSENFENGCAQHGLIREAQA
jgi:N-acetylglucosamine kinase-like BadF-type ATPase